MPSTLQHTATHCNALHRSAHVCELCVDMNGMYTQLEISYLQHSATPCSNARNKLQGTATHCEMALRTLKLQYYTCNTLQYTAVHCNTLQHNATHCNTLQSTATHCNTMQHTATHRNTLQQNATEKKATCEFAVAPQY